MVSDKSIKVRSVCVFVCVCATREAAEIDIVLLWSGWLIIYDLFIFVLCIGVVH